MTIDPTERFEREAARAGFTADVIDGATFRHRIFTTPAGDDRHGTLHVYFGGDGSPFLRRDLVTRDPTPRRPLALELMARGPRPAVYLGRPCYHGTPPGCHPRFWTIERYSEPIVASMAAAVEHLAERQGAERVALIGYSGGGALALLVAERVPAVSTVITLAANLDTDAWTALHDYSPLIGSLNPADFAGSRAALRHLHLTGDKDRNVPPRLHDRLRERLPAEAFETMAGFDHRCCWAEMWPELGARIDRLIDRAPRARADAR